jgi:hypothetical protein
LKNEEFSSDTHSGAKTVCRKMPQWKYGCRFIRQMRIRVGHGDPAGRPGD